MLDINELKFDEVNYYKTKNGNYIELRVDEDPYIDTDNATVGYGNFISFETYREGDIGALREMYQQLDGSTIQKIDNAIYEYYNEHKNDFKITEEYFEDYNEWSYNFYDENGNHIEGIEYNEKQDLEDVFNDFFDAYCGEILSNDIEEYLDFAGDDVLQYTFQNDPTTQAYRSLIYCENTENLSFEEFDRRCNRTFNEAYAVENFGMYAGTIYDFKGDEIDTIYDLPEDILVEFCKTYNDTILEEIEELPDFDEIIEALKPEEIEKVNKFIEDNDLLGQVDYLWTVNDVKDQIHTELENGEYGFVGKLCQMVEELENSPYEYVYADFNSGFRPIGHIDELFEYFETDLEGLDIEKPEQNTPSYNEEER